MKRIAAKTVLAVVLAAAAVVLAVHAPAVRRMVLRYAIAQVQRRYAIRIDADRLDYNLAALTVGLANVRVAADTAPQAPFFSADYASVSLSARAWAGAVTFKQIVITDGRVRIIRDASGRTNLPASSSTPSGAPAALDVARLFAPSMDVGLQDAVNGVALTIPALHIDIGRTTGTVSLGRPATFAKGDTRTRITSLRGGAAFDGRALHVTSLTAKSDEATGRLDGTLSLLVRDPSIDLHATGDVDVERLARWLPAFAGAAGGKPSPSAPRGDVAFDAHATGAMASPSADVTLTSPQLAWRGVTVTDARVASHLTSEAANVRDAEFAIAGGRVRASGTIPFADAAAHVTAAWSGVDTAMLVDAVVGTISVVPSATLSGELTADGPLATPARLTANVSLRADGGTTRRGRIAVPGATHLTLANGRWQIDAHHRLGAAVPVTLTAGGELDDQDLLRSTIAGRVVIDDIAVASLLSTFRSAGLLTVANGTVSGGVVGGTIALQGRLQSPRMSADVTGRNLAGAEFDVPDVHLAVTGDPAVPALSFTARADAATIAGEQIAGLQAAGRFDHARLTIDRASASQASRSGTLSLTGAYDVDAETFRADADVRQWSVVATADRPLDATLDATFQGAGTVSAPRGDGSIRVANATWRGASLGDLDAEVRLDGQAATVTSHAPALNTTLDARAILRAPYDATMDVRVDRLDLARITPADAPVAITGTLSAAAHAQAPLENWKEANAHVEVTSVDARAGDLPLRLTSPAAFEYGQHRLHVIRFEAMAGETRMSASGDLPGAGVQLAVDGNIGEAVRAVAATGLAVLPVSAAAGPLTLRGLVSGTLDAPLVTADLSAGPGSVTIKDLSTASGALQAHLDPDAITIRSAAVTYEGATVDANGSIPLALLTSTTSASRTVPGSLHATVKNITPSVLRGLIDPASLEDVAGTIDAAVNVESPSLDPSAVTGDVTLTRLDVQMAGLPITQRTPTRIVAKDGFARIESWNWAGEGGTLGVVGQVRLADRQAAIIANGDIDLRVLTPLVRTSGMTTAGRLTPKVSITGPIDAPRIDGDVALDGGEIRLGDPRIIVDGLTARATLTRTTAAIRSMSGTINGGTLTGGGTFEYEPDAGLDAQLTADIRDMALEFPAGLRSELNAALRLDAASAPGEAAPAGMLSGTVTVQHGSYREPLAVVGGLLEALRARNEAASAAAADTTPFLDRLALGVRVQTDEDVLVDNNYARAGLAADLDLIGTAAAPAMSGRATIRDGGQLFVGRNIYTVRSDVPSTIDFVSATAIEPELNVHVTTHVAGEDIDLDLTGPAESPQVAMSSTNGESQADITALLLTGRKLDDLAAADASFIGTQVIGNLSGEVLGFAGRAIGLDTLRLGGVDDTGVRQDPTAAATEVDPTSRLTFSKALGSQVDLTFSQSLRDSTAQTWIVDYLPARQLELRVASGDTDLRTYRVRHDISFGGARVATPRAASSTRAREPRVTDIAVSGELGVPEQRLHSILKLRTGDTFDFGRWQEDRDRLEDFYRANGHLTARVAASRMANGGEVKLAYVIDAGPQTSIAVSGIDLSREELAQLSDAWATSIFDGFLVDEATQLLRRDLASRGYLQSSVMARVVTTDGMKTLQVDVQPGARTSETRINVSVDDASLAQDLDARVSERHLDARVSERHLDAQVVADPGAVTRDLTAYLRARGYLRAAVTAGAPLFREGTTTVPVTVKAGPLFTIASVAFEGREGMSADDVATAAAIAAGVPYDPAAIDAARQRLLTLYRSRGYPAAEIASRADVQPDQQAVAVTFIVHENAQQTIGDVAVSGNGGVKSDVVTRALGLTVGAPLEPAELVRARTRVFNTGLFRRVDVTTEMMPRSASAAGAQPMRIRVDVEAWPALRLRYGFQVAEVHPESNPTGLSLQPGLSAEVIRRTLFGRNVSLSGVVEAERFQNTARGLLSAPTLFALPVQSSLVIERVHQVSEAAAFTTDRNGVSWEQRQRSTGHFSLSYSYRFDRDHTFGSTIDPLTGTRFDLTVNVARLIGNAAWDTRNDPLDAARGSFYSSSLQWAPAQLGSQFRFVKYVGQGYRFTNVRGVVLASAARLGLVAPLGGQELIISERFFAGGARTVRGVDEGALGPRDVFGDPAGGDGMVVFNQEARVPLYKWLRGVAFIDAGNVFRQPRDIRLNQLTGSIGLGVRLSTPFALIRADYGRVEWLGATTPPAGTNLHSGQWTIGIGQAF